MVVAKLEFSYFFYKHVIFLYFLKLSNLFIVKNIYHSFFLRIFFF